MSESAGPRWLPAVHECLARVPESVRALAAGGVLERAALERALDAVRAALREDGGGFGSRADVERAVRDRWEAEARRLARPALAPVVNATGVVVHTNLGRAPLAPAAIDRIAALAGGYTNLEYDLDAGRRGARGP